MINKVSSQNRISPTKKKNSLSDKIISYKRSRMNIYIGLTIGLFSFILCSVATAKYMTSTTTVSAAPVLRAVDVPLQSSDILFNQSSDQYMPLSMKKEIYNDYISTCQEIETNATVALDQLDPVSKKLSQKIVIKKANLLKHAEINKMQNRLKKTIKNLPDNYIREIVIVGHMKKW
jgi:hypothetical protein